MCSLLLPVLVAEGIIGVQDVQLPHVQGLPAYYEYISFSTFNSLCSSLLVDSCTINIYYVIDVTVCQQLLKMLHRGIAIPLGLGEHFFQSKTLNLEVL